CEDRPTPPEDGHPWLKKLSDQARRCQPEEQGARKHDDTQRQQESGSEVVLVWSGEQGNHNGWDSE
ncbi:hypothetical protein ACXWP3_09690, partial [Streptococcus pyogenes]